MDAAAYNSKTEKQKCELKMDVVPIVQSMFNKTTAYDAHLTLHGNGLEGVSYKTVRPIAERTDIYILLEQWAFGRSCRIVREMIKNETKFDYLTVNISVRYLKSDRYIQDIKKILEGHGVPADKICLEVSEKDLEADTEKIIGKLYELKKEGFMIAVDDYSGLYIPLSTLDSVPFDIIKIDKDLSVNIQADRKAEQTVRSIIEFAKGLNREVIAKAVSDEKNKYMLIALGCEKIQGLANINNQDDKCRIM